MPLLITGIWCHQIDVPKSKLNTELYIFCCIGHQNAPNCTDLSLYFQKIPGVTSPYPITRERTSLLPRPLPLVMHPPSHFFTASVAAVPEVSFDERKCYLYSPTQPLTHSPQLAQTDTPKPQNDITKLDESKNPQFGTRILLYKLTYSQFCVQISKSLFLHILKTPLLSICQEL